MPAFAYRRDGHVPRVPPPPQAAAIYIPLYPGFVSGHELPQGLAAATNGLIEHRLFASGLTAWRRAGAPADNAAHRLCSL